MTNRPTIRDHERVFNSIAHCAHCGHPMIKTGPNYTCPTLVNNDPNICPTQPINAQELLELVFTQLIKRVINEQAIQQIIKTTHNEFDEKIRQAQDNLDRTERTISELKETKKELLYQVEQGAKPFPDVADKIREINMTVISLSYEARLGRRELDKYNFVTDEERIKANALDLGTYLEAAAPELIKDLVNMFIRNIKIANDCVVINYTNDDPEADQKDECSSDRIPLHRGAAAT